MLARVPPALVFASIDGLPLAIDDSHRRLPALLAALAAERVMIVFSSARTRAEMERFRQSIGIFHPFICEDGAAVFVPMRYFGAELHHARHSGGYQAVEFALSYEAVTAAVRRAAGHLRIPVLQFADMSIDDAARECGLSLLDARLAKLREYGELFRLLRPKPDDERRLCRALLASGIYCTRQGAFLHAVSVDGPGAAAAVLNTLYRTAFGAVFTAASGHNTAAFDARVDASLDAIPLAAPAPADTVGWIEGMLARVRVARDASVAPVAARVGA